MAMSMRRREAMRKVVLETIGQQGRRGATVLEIGKAITAARHPRLVFGRMSDGHKEGGWAVRGAVFGA
jgi:hypothetical protein